MLLCLAVAVAGMVVNHYVPLLSPLLVALVLGILAGNLLPLPDVLRPGLLYAAKPLLRLGIVLLGLQISFGAVWALGLPLLGVVVAATFLTFLFTTVLARRLGLRPELGLLVAAGCSICGAAAIAGMNGAVDAEEEDVASAVGIITFFGLLAIPAVPLLSGALRLPPEVFGAWSGASIHEVAQVVAAAGTVGGAALSVAVIVKLTRVLLLAPMVAGVTALNRRRAEDGTRPPLVPLFVLGFLVAVAIRSFVPVPPPVLDGVKLAQTLLLALAMFALGAGVHLRNLVTTGGRTIVTGAAATVFISAVSLAGILLVS